MTEQKQKLPLWRVIAGIAVFLGLFADLSLLAPVYYRNYEFEQYMISRLHGSNLPSDGQLRLELLERAKTLRLPVIPNDVRIQRQNGITTLRTAYKIQVDLGLYSVGLHFRPEASSR